MVFYILVLVLEIDISINKLFLDLIKNEVVFVFMYFIMWGVKKYIVF